MKCSWQRDGEVFQAAVYGEVFLVAINGEVPLAEGW